MRTERIHMNERKIAGEAGYLHAAAVAARSMSLAQLGAALGGDVVDIVERMHATIAERPVPLGAGGDAPTRGVARLVYRSVHGGFAAFSGAAGAAARLLGRLGQEQEGAAGDGWTAVRAALNGVVGDLLEEQENPLAQPMTIGRRAGRGSTFVLFAHGLCMSERGWDRGGFPAFGAWCRGMLRARTGHLVYNSGRHISSNGKELAGLLEIELRERRVERFVLIGHSMGGLLIRSACHYAVQQGYDWPNRVTHVATLGSPHHGAPWERIGSFANRLLVHSPYTRPLSRLGSLRSAGIRDLRHGALLDEDWVDMVDDPEHAHDRRRSVALLDGAKHLFVAATRSKAVPEPVWCGRDDLLVTVASALGLSRDGSRRIEGPHLERFVLADLNHMALMGNPAVFERMRAWLV